MIGGIIGDIIGSIYEKSNINRYEFQLFKKNSRFTDDSVLSCAVADSILTNSSYCKKLKEYFSFYKNAGYGASFYKWANANKLLSPYNSWGNGSAMRVGPVGFAFSEIKNVLKEAKKSAECTHNHIEGIKGAKAVALSINLSLKNYSKDKIRNKIQQKFNYNLDFSYKQLKNNYSFDVSCQGSVPQAIFCFLISTNFEDAIRKAVSIGGDSDTIANITGNIAHSFYKIIPKKIWKEAKTYLDKRLLKVTKQFMKKYNCGVIIK